MAGDGYEFIRTSGSKTQFSWQLSGSKLYLSTKDDVFYFGKDDPWIDMSFSHGVSSVEITGVVREVNEDAM